MPRSDRVTVSLFPFMSVLACTIGVLMLLLAAISVRAVGSQAALEEAVARTRLASAEARQQAAQDEAVLVRAESAWAALDEQLAARGWPTGWSAASIERELARLEADERAASRLARTQQALRRLERERGEVETTLAVLESRRETLPILIDPTGLSRRQKPFFVECDGGGITAHRATDDFQHFVPLEALSNGGDYGRYLRRVAALPGALVVLLVRPDGVATARRAEAIAREAGVRVARLPLPGTGPLDWALVRRAEGA
ncbi:MAG: hypothetical protein H6748_03040 [Spirochaetaceae bacterium]|nr:hypothetical protein [Myxococcales bacterium]MCB9723003.1 hypothetical protein [Spirochaetaceae bacterium]